jgi:plastocyanin
VVVIVAAGVALAVTRGGSNSNDNSTDTSMSNMDMTNKADTSNSTPVATNDVAIKNFVFSPANITVKKGTAVTWVNQDSTAHTVTENDGQTGPDSGPMANGQSYSFTFDTAGTFKYHCTFHPEMVGTVTVTE